MKLTFLHASVCALIAFTSVGPSAFAQNVTPFIDAKARQLFDRALQRYSKASTIQLHAEGVSVHGKERPPLSLDLKFERPSKARIEGEDTFGHSLYVADGKKVTSYDDLLESVTTHSLSDRYNLLTLSFGLRSASYPLGPYLANWLFGTHELQTKPLSQTMRSATAFSAKALPSTLINGRKAEGVRLSGTERPDGKIPARTWQDTLWFAPDGSVVRIEFSVSQYKIPVSGSLDIKSQTFDKTLPASTFVFQKPHWQPAPQL